MMGAGLGYLGSNADDPSWTTGCLYNEPIIVQLLQNLAIQLANTLQCLEVSL